MDELYVSIKNILCDKNKHDWLEEVQSMIKQEQMSLVRAYHRKFLTRAELVLFIQQTSMNIKSLLFHPNGRAEIDKYLKNGTFEPQIGEHDVKEVLSALWLPADLFDLPIEEQDKGIRAHFEELADALVREYDQEYGQVNNETSKCPMSGLCGDFMCWEIVGGDTLVISGEGEMDDYFPGNPPPWSGHAISNIIIEEGVQTIGKGAFSAEITAIRGAELHIPHSLKKIGDYAFSGTFLNTVSFPKDVQVSPSALYMPD